MLCKHHLSFHKPYAELYGENNASIVDIKDVNTKDFIYIHDCHFLAKRDILLKLCKCISNFIEIDSLYGKTTIWKDETYFNYYLNTVLLKIPQVKINIVDGRTYAHGWWYKTDQEIKVEYLNKDNPYVPFVDSSISKLD